MPKVQQSTWREVRRSDVVEFYMFLSGIRTQTLNGRLHMQDASLHVAQLQGRRPMTLLRMSQRQSVEVTAKLLLVPSTLVRGGGYGAVSHRSPGPEEQTVHGVLVTQLLLLNTCECPAYIDAPFSLANLVFECSAINPCLLRYCLSMD
jgi:hypothetical protein